MTPAALCAVLSHVKQAEGAPETAPPVDDAPRAGWSAEHVFARFNVSRESQERLRIFEKLLRHWQKRINLVSQNSLGGLWHRHIADGLQLDPLIGEPPQTIIDLGSGAGIPGLILALSPPRLTTKSCSSRRTLRRPRS